MTKRKNPKLSEHTLQRLQEARDRGLDVNIDHVADMAVGSALDALRSQVYQLTQRFEDFDRSIKIQARNRALVITMEEEGEEGFTFDQEIEMTITDLDVVALWTALIEASNDGLIP